MVNNNLLIIGAGLLGSEVKEIAEEMNSFKKIDYLDDKSDAAIGKLSDSEKYSMDYRYAYPAFDNPEERIWWIQKLEECCYTIPVLVHPRAYVSASAQLHKGVMVEPMAVIKGNTSIGVGCIVSAGTTVGAGSFIGDACYIGNNSTVAENTLVPAGTKILPCSYFELNRKLKIEDLFFKTENIVGKYEKHSHPHTPDVIDGRIYSFEDGF